MEAFEYSISVSLAGFLRAKELGHADDPTWGVSSWWGHGWEVLPWAGSADLSVFSPCLLLKLVGGEMTVPGKVPWVH